jgi:endonuclease/exonuclease/phosphatase (EEP) superfamily protein YafD
MVESAAETIATRMGGRRSARCVGRPHRDRRATKARVLKAAVAAYLSALLVAAGAIHALGDRWWMATALLFAPRWVLGLPLLVLVPAALATRRRPLAPLGAALVLLLGPVMGFEVPGPGALLHRDEPRDLRVMTANIGGGPSISSAALAEVLREIRPDVAAFQECDVDLDRLRSAGWFARSDGHLCVVSRFPVHRATRERDDLEPGGGSGKAVAYVLETPAGPLTLVNLHLATVRPGLFEVMHRGWRGAPDLTANSALRRLESRVARDRATRMAPRPIVVGDFNVPVESAIYREAWAAWSNAFSSAGLGFGWTKYTRWYGVRVDHVLHGPDWECRSAWVGPSLGFDHRPVVADLVRTRAGARGAAPGDA